MTEITIKSLKSDNLVHKLNEILSLFMNNLGDNFFKNHFQSKWYWLKTSFSWSLGNLNCCTSKIHFVFTLELRKKNSFLYQDLLREKN